MTPAANRSLPRVYVAVALSLVGALAGVRANEVVLPLACELENTCYVMTSEDVTMRIEDTVARVSGEFTFVRRLISEADMDIRLKPDSIALYRSRDAYLDSIQKPNRGFRSYFPVFVGSGLTDSASIAKLVAARCAFGYVDENGAQNVQGRFIAARRDMPLGIRLHSVGTGPYAIPAPQAQKPAWFSAELGPLTDRIDTFWLRLTYSQPVVHTERSTLAGYVAVLPHGMGPTEKYRVTYRCRPGRKLSLPELNCVRIAASDTCIVTTPWPNRLQLAELRGGP
jgi:hypothetical protein